MSSNSSYISDNFLSKNFGITHENITENHRMLELE